MSDLGVHLMEINTKAYSPTDCSSGSPCSVVENKFVADIKATGSKKKAPKKGGVVAGGGSGSAAGFSLSTPFFQHYVTWYNNYYGEEFKVPRFNKQDLNLEHLWKCVKERGGSQQTTTNKQWSEIGRQFNPPKSMTNVSYHIRRLYEKYLLAYEKTVSPHTAMAWRKPQGSKSPSTTTVVIPQSATVPNTPAAEDGNNKGMIKIESSEPASCTNISEQLQQLQMQQKSSQLNYCSRRSSGDNVNNKSNNSNSVEFIQNLVVAGDEQLVGAVIRLWNARKNDYEVVKVVSFDATTGAHTIRFSNGVLNVVFLDQHTWSVCTEDSEQKRSSCSVKPTPRVDLQYTELDLQFLKPVEMSPTEVALGNSSTQLQLDFLSQSGDINSLLSANQRPTLNLLQPNEPVFEPTNRNLFSQGLEDIQNTLSTQLATSRNPMETITNTNNVACNASNTNYASLVSALQTQLSTAVARIEDLESRERVRQQEQETARLQFAVREKQLQLMVEQMAVKLREANEAKQLAEGAANELRKCFELMIANGNAVANTAAALSLF
eukprot:TRINITY_DN1298_c0_g1_i3.p1 TRINITY_DN1298_c0_g1~~TRINITY_DN1298_c0_g1_i3.p1  ORF type:complete len:548 (-),score=85.85 TRINITY_DN1298_c0_g1_i3:3366-5009(-)